MCLTIYRCTKNKICCPSSVQGGGARALLIPRFDTGRDADALPGRAEDAAKLIIPTASMTMLLLPRRRRLLDNDYRSVGHMARRRDTGDPGSYAVNEWTRRTRTRSFTDGPRECPVRFGPNDDGAIVRVRVRVCVYVRIPTRSDKIKKKMNLTQREYQVTIAQ